MSGNEKRKLNRSLGLCGCGKATRPNRRNCEKCCGEISARGKTDRDRARTRGLCVKCKTTPTAVNKHHCGVCLEKSNALTRKVKERVFEMYGRTCGWPSCDVSDLDMLTIDHVYGGGTQDRKNKKKVWGGSSFYRFLLRLGISQEYQTLCMNHQFKKKMLLLRGDVLPAELQVGRSAKAGG